MVTKYGMSDVMGTMVYADAEAGYGMHSKTISEATQQKWMWKSGAFLMRNTRLHATFWNPSAMWWKQWQLPCWNGKPSTPSKSKR